MSNQPKFPISDEEMKVLLEKYPFLCFKSWWSSKPKFTQKTIEERIEHNYYKYFDGSGWEDLWKNRYLPRLFKACDSWSEEDKAQFYFSQVKEKFGELRIYTSFSTKDRLERIAEALSGWICARCGKEPRDQYGRRVIWTAEGWITHLCEECAKKDLRADGVSEGDLLDELDKMKTTQVKPDGFIQFSHEGEIRTTYKDTPDGWYEVDKVTTIQRK